MKTIVYVRGRKENEEEMLILDESGERITEDSYNFTLWEINFKSWLQVLKLSVKLKMPSFKVHVPDYKDEQPIIEFFACEKRIKELSL